MLTKSKVQSKWVNLIFMPVVWKIIYWNIYNNEVLKDIFYFQILQI